MSRTARRGPLGMFVLQFAVSGSPRRAPGGINSAVPHPHLPSALALKSKNRSEPRQSGNQAIMFSATLALTASAATFSPRPRCPGRANTIAPAAPTVSSRGRAAGCHRAI